MADVSTPLPARRTELLIRPLAEPGRYVVKHPQTGGYFQLGEEEHFLLNQLDGRRNSDDVRTAYAERFGRPLPAEDVDEFVQLATEQQLVRPSGAEATASQTERSVSILHWRVSVFDPDRLFTQLAPRLWYFWTPAFLVLSAGCIVLAAGVAWAERAELARSAVQALRWETAVLVWFVLVGVGVLHEFAHGLTCKRHGGEVHEVGFLCLYFVPGFYCNVSDAWLFRERSKRLWVTFAGAYFELFLWALAVLIWRVTVPETFINRLAFVVVTVCGVQTLFNFLPLLKLDGYYLLSDWLRIPNLQQRAVGRFKAHVRRLLWGAPRPDPDPRSRFLTGFGLATWVFGAGFLALVLYGLFTWALTNGGWVWLVLVALLGILGVRALFRGFCEGEVVIMIRTRKKRALVWLSTLVGIGVALARVEMTDRVAGPFQVCSAARTEVRAPVAGFLQAVHFDEGERVSAGTLVAVIEVPDLASRQAQKGAEVREAQARLRMLEVGPRPDVMAEQRSRVERAQNWRDLAGKDLDRARRALAEDLAQIDKQLQARQAELDLAREGYKRARTLLSRKAITDEDAQEADARVRVNQARFEQTQAERRARETRGVVEAETEFARRERQMADARATLTLLEAGTRPEEIEAERARLARLEEEERYLTQLQGRVSVYSPVAGVVTTVRLREKVGQYLKEGDSICVVEDPTMLVVEVALAEQDARRILIGQAVGLKARSLPFDTLAARVGRVAPVAVRGESHGTVTVYCHLKDIEAGLCPGMTGHARIYTGDRPIGEVALDRVLRFVRTEFWW